MAALTQYNLELSTSYRLKRINVEAERTFQVGLGLGKGLSTTTSLGMGGVLWEKRKKAV